MELEDLLQRPRARHLSLSWTKSIQSTFCILLLEDQFQYYLSKYSCGFQVVTFFQVPDQDPVCISHLCLICAIHSAPPSLLDFVTGMIFVESYEVRKSL